MGDKNKIQGYYNSKTKQNEYKPIIDDYTPVDYGTAEKNAPQQIQSLTVYVVIIVVLSLFLFFLTLSIGNMMSTNEKLNKRIKELETYISSTEEQSTVSKTENVEETNRTTVAPVETTEIIATTEPAPTFEYDVKYISHKVDYDRNGNPVLLVTYEFTNNSDESASWVVKLHNKVFQTGIECGGIAFHDEITSQMQMNDIQPGITVTIVEGYPLYDDTSTVTLECKEFLGDEPMFVMELELVE